MKARRFSEENLIAMEHLEELDEFCACGCPGMGGVGKTTLAKMIYKKVLRSRSSFKSMPESVMARFGASNRIEEPSMFMDAFEYAALKGHTNLLDTLHTEFPNWSPDLIQILNTACKHGHHAFVSKLLNLYPECATDEMIYSATIDGHSEVLAALLKVVHDKERVFKRKVEGWTPLHVAAAKSDILIMDLLDAAFIEAAEELTYEGESCLHIAARFSNFQAFNLGVSEEIKSMCAMISNILTEEKKFQELHSSDRRKETLEAFCSSNMLIEIKNRNANGLTALDRLYKYSNEEVGNYIKACSPIHLATLNGYAKVIPDRTLVLKCEVEKWKFLLANGKGDIRNMKLLFSECPEAVGQLKDEGQSCLHLAAEFTKTQAFDKLVAECFKECRLEHSASKQDINGDAPLHVAALLGNLTDYQQQAKCGYFSTTSGKMSKHPGFMSFFMAMLHQFGHQKEHSILHNDPNGMEPATIFIDLDAPRYKNERFRKPFKHTMQENLTSQAFPGHDDASCCLAGMIVLLAASLLRLNVEHLSHSTPPVFIWLMHVFIWLGIVSGISVVLLWLLRLPQKQSFLLLLVLSTIGSYACAIAVFLPFKSLRAPFLGVVIPALSVYSFVQLKRGPPE